MLAVITGAGSGIGRSLTLRMAEKKIKVIAIGRTRSKLERVRLHYPNDIEIVIADVASNEGRREINRALNNRVINFLVHNAATLAPLKNLENVSIDEWRHCFHVNVEAPFVLTQSLLPQLATQSRVLHISSGLAHKVLPGLVPYSCSKAALHMLYKGWAVELATREILVGSVSPGLVDTPMQTALRSSSDLNSDTSELFNSFQQSAKLQSADSVAAVLLWMILQMPMCEYGSQEWTISAIKSKMDASLPDLKSQ